MGSTSFGYDNNGNITSDGIMTLSYDHKNQLTSVTGSANEVYAYDADNLRVKKVGLGTTYSENFDDGNIYDCVPTNWYTTGSYWSAASGDLHWTIIISGGQCSNPDLTFADFEADYDVMADGYYNPTYWAAFAFRKTNYSDWYSTSGYMVYYRYNDYIELYSASGGVLITSNTGKDLKNPNVEYRNSKQIQNNNFKFPKIQI